MSGDLVAPEDGTTRPSTGAEPADARSTDVAVLRKRIVAFVLDTALVGGICAALARRRASTSAGRLGLTVFLASTLGFGYHVALEGWRGQTVGKWLRGIVVVGADGSPCTFVAATRRTAGRVVDALPIGYLVGLAAIVSSKRDQRIGDRLADTVVVATDDRRERED